MASKKDPAVKACAAAHEKLIQAKQLLESAGADALNAIEEARAAGGKTMAIGFYRGTIRDALEKVNEALRAETGIARELGL